MSPQRLAAFMARVEMVTESGCWIWMASCTSAGYGQFRANGRNHSTHRLSYATFRGPIPAGLGVLHRCDVPSCVRPDHLFLGTALDNMCDMARKGRAGARYGEASHRAKLTDSIAAMILRRCRAGESQRRIARELGISQTTISRLVAGQTWRHLREAL